MDITKFDVTVTVVMALAVVAMSFVMPALGLTDTSTDENDIPELNVASDRFEIAQDRPNFPNTATKGTLWFNTTRDAAFSENSLWLQGSDGGSGERYQITLIEDPNGSQVNLAYLNGTTIVTESAVLNETNETAVLTNNEYTVAFELTEDHSPPEYLEVTWNIDKQGTTDSWIGRIPGVGALFATADLVASVLAWAVTIFIWFSTSLVFGALNLVGIIVDVSIYLISLLAWLSTTYASVVTSANSWVTVFVAIPGIILTLTLAKMVVIIFRSLPTT